MSASDPRSNARQGGAARVAQILRAAEAILVENGSLPLSMKEVSEAVGASRALVYTYFPDGAALAAAILADNFAALEQAGIEKASRSGPLAERAEACADLYLRHIAQRGPVIHVILRDREQLKLDADALRVSRRAVRNLGRAARTELAISPSEALALFEMLLTLPEEAGRLVFGGELDLDDARRTCSRLMLSGIDSIRPNPDGPA